MKYSLWAFRAGIQKLTFGSVYQVFDMYVKKKNNIQASELRECQGASLQAGVL